MVCELQVHEGGVESCGCEADLQMPEVTVGGHKKGQPGPNRDWHKGHVSLMNQDEVATGGEGMQMKGGRGRVLKQLADKAPDQL